MSSNVGGNEPLDTIYMNDMLRSEGRSAVRSIIAEPMKQPKKSANSHTAAGEC